MFYIFILKIRYSYTQTLLKYFSFRLQNLWSKYEKLHFGKFSFLVITSPKGYHTFDGLYDKKTSAKSYLTLAINNMQFFCKSN